MFILYQILHPRSLLTINLLILMEGSLRLPHLFDFSKMTYTDKPKMY